MKTEQQIRDRLSEAEKIRDEWIMELDKAKKDFEGEDYLDHCRAVIREAATEVTVLKWVLSR